ncbi:MAG: DUF2231 domain-containing protein [Opitutaceae bacterium]
MKKVYFLLSTTLLVCLGLLLAGLVIFTEAEVATEENLHLMQFFGRFHPVLLHLPIGLFLGLVVVEIAALCKCNEALKRSTHVLVWLMAITSVITAYFGLLLASNGDYSGDTLWLHKWLGILFSATALLVTFFKALSIRSAGKGTILYRLLMIGLLVLLPIVGHYGGNLTHGKGYLMEYAPAWLKGLLEEPEAVVEAVATPSEVIEGNLYTHQVQPLLEQYCVQCHGIEKQKSKYRLDTYEYLMTPGKMGDTPIEPYKISESMLIEYLWLPQSDDMAMPPEGKPRPSADEIMMLTHWVANGAEGPPVDEAALAEEQAKKEAEQAKIDQLISSGIMVLPLSLDTNFLYVDFQNAKGSIADEDFALLAGYKDRIREIKLMGLEVTTQQLEFLRGAPELRSLNLSGLANADAAVDVINSFTSLETLILFGSDLSDAGLKELSVPKAGSLYLGSTNVSPEQLSKLQKTNQQVQVYGDVNLDTVTEIQAIDLENSAEFKPEKN